jgi:ribonuclease P protein component
LVLYYSPRVGDDRPRFGFVVSRRIGGAVQRNRVKRLLREVARSLPLRLKAPVDMVFVAREPVRGLGFAEVRGVVEDLAARAGLIEQRDL